MMHLAPGTGSSLKRRILALGAGSAALAAVLLGALATVSAREQSQLREKTASVLAEQRIGDGIIRGVMRQLAIATDPASQQNPDQVAAFEEAGRGVYDGLRQYLFRQLTPAERLQIELVKEEHQQLEVSAGRMMSSPRGLSSTPPGASNDVQRHAFQLLDALTGFLQLRELELNDLLDAQGRAFRTIAWGGSLVILVFVLGQAWFAARFIRRRITAPLDSLADAMARVGAGDLEVRVPAADDLEFRALSESFNETSARLAATRSDLEAQNAALSDALVQIRSAQAELVESEKLGAIGRMTAGLAHELNNPLASVLGFSELLASRLRDRDSDEAELLTQEFVEPILREARRARLLVRSLLQFARSAESEIGPVSLREALTVVYELRRFAFAQAGITLDLGDNPDQVVIAERQHLQGMLLNVLNNALDALAPRGHGTVRVRARTEGDCVVVTVEDDGPGLSDPSRVFEAFYTTKDVGTGTGLGLALAERFMASFGGSISAENRVDGGALFVLKFKRPEGDAPAPRSHDSPAHASVLQLRHATRRQRVLVVEDEPHLQRLQQKLLARLDVEVEVCGSVAEARRTMTANRYDVIISDVKMPGESGLVLYDWVRREKPALLPHFLFVTGDVSAQELAEIARESPDAFLPKPFDAQEYLTRVGRLLGD